jgi:hypothetical protein
MGISHSSAAVNSTVSVLTSVVNSTAQSCQTIVTANQTVNITDSDHVIITDVDMTQTYTFDTNCTATVSNTTMTSTEMQQTIEQEAEALSKGFSLNIADAETCMNLVTNLSTYICNEFQTSLDNTVTSEQSINITTTSGAVVKGIDMDLYYDSVVQSTINIASSSSAATSLTQFLEQHASATAKGGGWLAIIIVTVIVFLLFMVGVSFKLFVTPAFWFLVSSICTLLFGYFTIAYIPKWWPYKRYQDSYTTVDPITGAEIVHEGDTDEERKDKEDHNKTTITWMGSLFGGFLAFDILMVVAAVFMGGWGGNKKDAKKKKQNQKQKKEEAKKTKQAQQEAAAGVNTEMAKGVVGQ